LWIKIEVEVEVEEENQLKHERPIWCGILRKLRMTVYCSEPLLKTNNE
jgi:hypothetical protein